MRRRPRRTTDALFAAAGGVLASLSVAAQPESAHLDRFAAEVRTLRADFEQTLWNADQQLIETASGSFALQRPDRFVWNYTLPIEQIVLADGEQLWMYDVELEQATVSPLHGQPASPALLLSGDVDIRDEFDLLRSYRADGVDWVELEPRAGGADFSSVAIGFRDGVPSVLEFVDGLNQTTHIEFSDIVVNEPLNAGLFELELADDVDVIGSAD